MARRYQFEKEHNGKAKKRFRKVLEVIIILLLMLAISVFAVAYSLYGNAMFSKEFIKDFKAQRYAYDNQSAETEQIVFFGDSITEMYLLGDHFPNVTIYNRGIGGDITSNMLTRLESNVLKIKPRKIFFLGGCNDLRRGIDPIDIASNINKILDKIQEKLPDTEIVVQSVYPVNRNIKLAGRDLIAQFNDDEVIVLNQYISQVCQSHNVPFVDTYSHLVGDNKQLQDQYTFDGLHMTDKAYELITSLLSPYVYDQLDTRSTNITS